MGRYGTDLTFSRPSFTFRCPVSDVEAPSTWAGASADDCDGDGGGEPTVLMSTSGSTSLAEFVAARIKRTEKRTAHNEQNPMRRSDPVGIAFEKAKENRDKTKRNNGEGHILSGKVKLRGAARACLLRALPPKRQLPLPQKLTPLKHTRTSPVHA